MTGYLKASEFRFRAEVGRLTRHIAGVRGGALTPLEYQSMVVNRVTKLARRLLPDAELYRRSLGAFPVIVRESLDELARRSAPQPRAGALAGPADDGTIWADDESDPVDAQWYFDRPSVQRLLSILPAGGQSMLALGVPTLGRPAARVMDKVRILDRSSILERESLGLAEAASSANLEVVNWDLGADRYRAAQEADIVVMDPPWYLEQYRAWLHTAVQGCRVGGTICLVLPQVLTNRCSVADRQEVLKILKSIGPLSLRPTVISYATPSFERAVLDLKGLGHLGRWRQADLALVRLRNKRLPYEFEPVRDIEWNYRKICGTIVRSWGESAGGRGMPVIKPVDAAAGYRLSSVSRLHLRTSGINLITSQGGAAVVASWGCLPQILDFMRDGFCAEVAVKAALPGASENDQHELATALERLLRRYGSPHRDGTGKATPAAGHPGPGGRG